MIRGLVDFALNNRWLVLSLPVTRQQPPNTNANATSLADERR
jgi:hypothetical protein